MKILIINPNSDEKTDQIMRDKVQKMALPEVDVDVVHVMAAPKLVCSYEEQATSTAEMIKIVQTTADKYDAYIVACHSDPNLELVKEIAHKPVVGIGEASMKIATMSGNGFAVISPSKNSISKKIALAQKYHCCDMLRTIKVTQSDSKEDLLAAAKEALEEFGVDVIVLGCANYANADGFIEEKLGVPVLDGISCALIIASGLVAYKRCKSAV